MEYPSASLGSTNNSSPYPYGLHPGNPENKWILDADEVANVKTAVASFNASIIAAASKYKLALWNANAFMYNLSTNGISINGVNINASFISGGAFSLDGVHLTPRGNAVVANQFIQTINAYYGSNIPLLNVALYRGVKMP